MQLPVLKLFLAPGVVIVPQDIRVAGNPFTLIAIEDTPNFRCLIYMPTPPTTSDAPTHKRKSIAVKGPSKS